MSSAPAATTPPLSYQERALALAIELGDLAKVQAALTRGADPNALNRGTTPFPIMAVGRADILAVDDAGRSAFDEATEPARSLMVAEMELRPIPGLLHRSKAPPVAFRHPL